MEEFGYIMLALNALAMEGKKGGVSSGRVANLIRYVLVRSENLIQQLREDLLKKADIVNGKVPMAQLPDGLDDMQEYPNRASFPAQGQNGIMYVAKDTNKTYRWSGTTYTVVSETLALGETSSTAYAGDKGKANAEAITVLRSLINTIQTSLTGKSDNGHSHVIADIAGLALALGGKSDTNHSHRWRQLSDSDDLADLIASGAVQGIGREDMENEDVIFKILRGDGTFSEGFNITPASSEYSGIMTPAMYNKLLEVDDKAGNDHTHQQSDVSGLVDALSTLTSKADNNKSAADNNAKAIELLREQLQGKVVSKTFATWTDAEGWMRDPISRRQLLPGSNIWIENPEEDDLWISEALDEPDMTGSNPTQYYYKVKRLKFEAPSLEGYAHKERQNTFTESNTFSNDVTIRGLLELFGQVMLYDDLTVYDAGESDGPSAHISGGTVSVGRGSRYVTVSGRITWNGVGGYSISRNPLSGSTVEKESCLNYEGLTFSETGKEDITITKEDFKALLAIKQQLINVNAPLDVTALLTNYSQDITFEDIQKAQKIFCTINGVYHEVRIAALREGEIVSDGALYYEDMTTDGLKKYIYTIAKVGDEEITTSEPAVIDLGGSDVDFVETSEGIYREDV